MATTPTPGKEVQPYVPPASSSPSLAILIYAALALGAYLLYRKKWPS